MNKPIRTISMFCMLLFLALMVNATYLQYWQADALNQDNRNRRIIQEAFSRERGAILVAGEAVAVSVESDDEYKFQRTYPLPLRYAPVTGWFSYYSQTGIEQSQNDVLSGDDSRLFVTRLVDLVNGNNTEGGRVSLTIDPDAQTAAFDGLRALGPDVQGAVVAIEPSTGKILANVSLPTYDPNLLASHDFASVAEHYDQLNEDPAKPLLNRGIQMTLPPGSTFKLVTAAAAIESGNWDASSQVPAGATYQLPADARRDRADRQRGPLAVQPEADPLRGGHGVVVQHHLRPARHRGRRRGDARAGRGVRLQRALPRRPRPAGHLGLPAPAPTSRRPGRRASASSTCARRRCRWRWSPPASPTAAR